MAINNISKINIGKKTIIDSGSIVTMEKNIHVQFGDGFELEFKFENDDMDTNSRSRLLPSELSPKKAILEIINFNNSLGQMILNPMPFASNVMTKLTMFVNFAVYKVGAGTVLHYTFFEEKING